MRYLDRSVASQAWLLIPLALLIGGLILLFGRGGSDADRGVRVLESTASGMVLFISPEPPGDRGRRERAMANLAEFRAHYRQLSPFVSVIATDDSAAGADFARELGDLLAQYNLGNRVKQAPAVPEAAGGASIRLRCGPGDASVGRDMITALAPLLQGQATITFDGSLGVADLVLAVSPDARASGP